MKIRKLALLGLLTAIALTIFMVEAQIPAVLPLPGVKLGLANIVTVFTVFALGPRDGALVLSARIFLGAVFSGNFSTNIGVQTIYALNLCSSHRRNGSDYVLGNTNRAILYCLGDVFFIFTH